MSSEIYKVFLVTIESDQNGVRLDKVLATHPDISSRSRAAQLIQMSLVLLENHPVKVSRLVKTHEVYQVSLPRLESEELQVYDFPIEIVHEDEDLLVVNKPAGIVVHPAAGHTQDTLVNALLSKMSRSSMDFSENRPGIVHRLDKDTSGLLVVAKNDSTQMDLVQQFKARSIHRVYKALCFGAPRLPSQILQSYVLRHPQNRKKFASEELNPGQAPKGKIAITSYRVLNSYHKEISLLECRLKTGRTHQIRIHLSELGHPLLGDLLYGTSHRANKLSNQNIKTLVKSLHRLGLHASELGFTHPRTGKELMFQAPWPLDLQNLVNTLGFT